MKEGRGDVEKPNFDIHRLPDGQPPETGHHDVNPALEEVTKVPEIKRDWDPTINDVDGFEEKHHDIDIERDKPSGPQRPN